jgi:hypothetical protein
VSFLEIYREKINDLLNPTTKAVRKQKADILFQMEH